ncbi:MAG: SufS family cysteine desulfurase [Myxococcales bacterium]|nr:SufS family cysteine desulfurase [Myxococcales bacterium]
MRWFRRGGQEFCVQRSGSAVGGRRGYGGRSEGTIDAVRSQFVGLQTEVHGHPLAWLDNAATTLKPTVVLQALTEGHTHAFANVHRGVHAPSVRSTRRYEAARARAAAFVGAASGEEVVFVRGATEGLNLLAGTLGARLGAGDNVVITQLDHHASFVPWQRACAEAGAQLRVAPIDALGRVAPDDLAAVIDEGTQVVCVPHASNAFGTVLDVAAIAELAHAHGARLVVDGAQAAPHLPIDVGRLGADAYVLSGHKVYGPQGIGVLWARAELLESLPPWQAGGEMVLTVTEAGTTYREPPHRFEAGTPNAVGAMGLAAAFDFLYGIGFEAVAAHERSLAQAAREGLAELGRVRLFGDGTGVPVVSFLVEGVHPHDVGTLLDLEGVAVRTGHHCAMPAMEALDIAGTTRASFAVYNTRQEVDRLVAAVRHTIETLG